MRAFLLLLLLAHSVASAHSFCGPVLSGAVGWDFFRDQERREFFGNPSFFAISNGSANGFCGGGFLGWLEPLGRFRYGGRVGYLGYSDDRIREMPLFQANRADFWKIQSVLFEITPALTFCRCWLVRAIFGFGFTQHQYFGREITGRVFRNERLWAAFPRFGAGLEWNFWRCLSAGFDWTYNFPGNVVYQGPKEGPSERDGNRRRQQVRGNQILFTLNWYFG